MFNIFKHKPFKLYRVYNNAKDIFVEPKLHWRFGLWKNDPNLPVWRRGPIINLYRRFSPNIYNPKTGVRIKLGSAGTTRQDGTIRQYDEYTTTHHKLPGKMKRYRPMWKSEFRRKLRKWGFGWWPTQIELPLFFAFHIFNYDVCWKTKFDDYRYEFPPLLSIVFFGLSFSVWLTAPDNENDDYWESILWYWQYGSLADVDKEMGYWVKFENNVKVSIPRLKDEYIKEPYRSALIRYRKGNTK